jgi:hypothetical protein
MEELSIHEDVTSLGAEELDTEFLPKHLAKAPVKEMTLGEIQAIAMGANTLSTAGLKKFRDNFVKIARGMKEETLKESALLMESMSEKALEAKDSRAGLKLIFRKLDDLVTKTKVEAKEDLAEMTTLRSECQTNIGKASQIITEASEKETQNNMIIKNDHETIVRNKKEWETSRIEEEKVQGEFEEMVTEREDTSAAAKQRIDERNQAIDVMVKATFIVCEKFKRFRNTNECKSIKSRPDVNEPGQPVFPPSPTMLLPVAWGNHSEADIKNSAAQTKAYEESMAEVWEEMFQADEKLEGSANPENLPMHTVNKRGTAENNENAAHDIDPNSELMEDESVDMGVSEEEKPALHKLAQLGQSEHINSRYTLPITELAIALGEGKTGKSKSIIMILLDVKGLTEDEQRADKLSYVQALQEFYKRSWELKDLLDNEESKQQSLQSDIEERRIRMKETQADNEEQRKLIKTQIAVRTAEQDRCELLEEQFGVRDAIRKEDLENIAKLISLLRSLYDKRHPTNCKKSAAVKPVMCTHEDNGWCIWSTQDGSDQRCSCNVGFYGEICEKKMCPGMGKTMFMHDADGVCSNRGSCDTGTGRCKCHKGFYHGPKNACELKHCPASKNGMTDEKCSGHGSCDTKRGLCNCVYEWSGLGCQNVKCPNSNTVLYPHSSSNACDGRGACDVETGKCVCGAPYKGQSCELSDCPRNCMKRGGCEESTGSCKCTGGYLGHSCEFKSCPDNCGNGGECNRHNGKCVCKDGYSGLTCRKSTRCPAAMGTDLAVKEVNWYTMWDKPGWITCPIGQSIYALRRGICDALDCLEGGSCAAPCEGESWTDATPIKIRHCYHDLNVYFSMDKEGWSKCEANYFVGGFYRSGSSLYNLQMFKCCSYEKSRWSMCSEENWATKFNAIGRARAPAHKFLVGLYRGKGHKLRDIDRAYTCGWVRGY